MAVRQFREFDEGQRPSAEELNRLVGLVESHTTFTAPASYNDVTGLHTREPEPAKILAKITGVSGSAYSWVEMEGDASGLPVVAATGLSGTTTVNPAYEIGGSTTVATNSIVEMFPGNGEYWFFTQPSMGGGAGTLTVREVDTVPTVTMVTTLSFDQVDGFIVSNPAAGEAEIDLADASLTQRGIISLTAQTMGDGDKTFDDNVFAGKRFVATGLSVGAPLGTVYFVSSDGQIGIGNDTGSDAIFFGTVTGGTFKLRLHGATSPTQALAVFSSESGDTFATPAFAISADGGTTVSRGLYDTIATPANNWTITGGIVTAKLAGSTLIVDLGGTGATSFTLRGILFGNGTSPLGVTAAGTTGQVLTATTAGDPTWQNLAETNSTTKGIVNLVDQFLGAGNKTVETLVVAGGVSISITGAKAQFDGIAYFGSDIWIKHTQSIIVYNAGVTASRIFFNTTLSEISIDLADGSDLLRLRLDTFLSNTLCDLTHNGAGVVPQFAVNGTPGITTSDGVGITTKGGIVTGVTSTGSEFLSRNFLGI